MIQFQERKIPSTSRMVWISWPKLRFYQSELIWLKTLAHTKLMDYPANEIVIDY